MLEITDTISTMVDIDKETKCCNNDSPQFKRIEDSAKLLKVLSDVNRIKILCILSQEKICVCDLAEKLEVGQNLVSHHLKVLEDAGVLEKRRDGNQMFYSILPKKGTLVSNLKTLIGIS